MTVKTAWETSVGQAYKKVAETVASDIKEDIYASKIHLDAGAALTEPYSYVYDLEVLSKPVCVIPYNGEKAAAFRHPVVIENADTRYAAVVAVDVRPCMTGSWGKMPKMNKPIQLAWYKALGLMQGAFVSEGFNINVLKSMSNFPAALYAAMITEAVSRRYYLDMREQVTIQILSAYFYSNCLLATDTQADIDRQVGELIKITRCDAQMIKGVLMQEGVSQMKTLADLCECIKTCTGSVRMQDMSLGVLITTLGGYWLGFNAKEMIGVALEHVPTWLVLAYASLASHSYKRSLLSKTGERVAKVHNGSGFVAAMARQYLLTTAQELQ